MSKYIFVAVCFAFIFFDYFCSKSSILLQFFTELHWDMLQQLHTDICSSIYKFGIRKYVSSQLKHFFGYVAYPIVFSMHTARIWLRIFVSQFFYAFLIHRIIFDVLFYFIIKLYTYIYNTFFEECIFPLGEGVKKANFCVTSFIVKKSFWSTNKSVYYS